MRALPPGPFVRSDLETIGVTRSVLHSGLRDGSIRQVLRGVYIDAEVPLTIEVRAAAAFRVIAPHHVVVDRTAAWLHGVDAYAGNELDHGVEVDICARRGARHTDRYELNAGERDLRNRDVIDIGGVAVTTPLRTAMDLGCKLKRREAYAAMNDLARLHGLNRADFRRELVRYRRRRGVIQMRELTQLVDPRIESPRESWVRLAIHDAALPEPTPQLVVHLDGREFRIDFAYPGARIAVEYDGEQHHSDGAAIIDDDRRREQLRQAGWKFIVVRRGDFSGEALDEWLRTLRGYLEPRYTTLRTTWPRR